LLHSGEGGWAAIDSLQSGEGGWAASDAVQSGMDVEGGDTSGGDVKTVTGEDAAAASDEGKVEAAEVAAMAAAAEAAATAATAAKAKAKAKAAKAKAAAKVEAKAAKAGADAKGKAVVIGDSADQEMATEQGSAPKHAGERVIGLIASAMGAAAVADAASKSRIASAAAAAEAEEADAAKKRALLTEAAVAAVAADVAVRLHDKSEAPVNAAKKTETAAATAAAAVAAAVAAAKAGEVAVALREKAAAAAAVAAAKAGDVADALRKVGKKKEREVDAATGGPMPDLKRPRNMEASDAPPAQQGGRLEDFPWAYLVILIGTCSLWLMRLFALQSLKARVA
jgi:trimeric autotransporter adhesin